MTGGHRCKRYHSGFVPRRPWQSVYTTWRALFFVYTHLMTKSWLHLIADVPVNSRNSILSRRRNSWKEWRWSLKFPDYSAEGLAAAWLRPLLRLWSPPAARNIHSLVWLLTLKQHVWKQRWIAFGRLFQATRLNDEFKMPEFCSSRGALFCPLNISITLVVTSRCRIRCSSHPRGVKTNPPFKERSAFWRHVSADVIKSQRSFLYIKTLPEHA